MALNISPAGVMSHYMNEKSKIECLLKNEWHFVEDTAQLCAPSQQQ
jgi:hypothetical protein